LFKGADRHRRCKRFVTPDAGERVLTAERRIPVGGKDSRQQRALSAHWISR
jgi:hypothetical protein